MSDSQKMNEVTDQYKNVPEEWVLTNVGKISKIIHYGYTASSTDEPTGTKMLRITDIQNNIVNWDTVPFCEIEPKDKEKCLLRDGDLVFTRTGATVGKSFLIRGKIPEAVFASYLIRIILSDQIDKDYVYDFFQSHAYWLQINERQIGTGQPNVNSQILSKIVLPLPPLPEQQFIVAKVESLLDHVKKAKESLDKIPLIMKRFRQAALKKAFSGELTAEWREQQQDLEPAAELLKRIQEERERRQKQFKKKPKQETELLDSSELPELPERWVWTRLEDLSLNPKQDIVDGPFGSDMKSSEYREEGIPLIRLQNIDRNRFISKNFKFISSDKAKELSRHSFSKGDIVITKLGDPLGEACIVPDEIEWGIIVADVVRITVAEQFVNKFFISYLLNSDIIIKQLVEKTKGTTRSRVNLSHIRELELPLPPLPEQLEIFRRIESLFKFADETEKNAAEARKRVEIMTQSILARAFRGDLSADFREAVRNWKDLDGEARGRYVFVLSEEEREKVIEADEFPMEEASYLLKRVMEEKGKIERKKGSINKRREKPNKHLLNDEIGNIVK